MISWGIGWNLDSSTFRTDHFISARNGWSLLISVIDSLTLLPLAENRQALPPWRRHRATDPVEPDPTVPGWPLLDQSATPQSAPAGPGGASPPFLPPSLWLPPRQSIRGLLETGPC